MEVKKRDKEGSTAVIVNKNTIAPVEYNAAQCSTIQ